MSLLATSIALALMNAACGGAADTTAAVTEAAVAGTDATTLDLDETGKRRRESERRRTSNSATGNTATTIQTTTTSTPSTTTTTATAPGPTNTIASVPSSVTNTTTSPALNTTQTVASVTNTAQPITGPVIMASDMEYLGAFALPVEGDRGSSRFGYGSGAISTHRDSSTGKLTLFMSGHTNYPGHIAQVEVPDAFVKSNNWYDLPLAKLAQKFRDVTNGDLVSTSSTLGYDSNGASVFGTLPYNGQLIVSAVNWYSYSQNNSHTSVNLDFTNNTSFLGFKKIIGSDTPIRATAGEMALIPQGWQAALGGKAFAGYGTVSVIGTASYGPALTTFDPDAISRRTDSSGKTLLYYPASNPLCGSVGCDNTNNSLFNWTTAFHGFAPVATTQSLLFVGTHGTGGYWYGGMTSPDGSMTEPFPENTAQGPHSTKYEYRITAYNVNDFALVNQGKLKPWEVKPYAAWSLSELTQADPAARIRGAGYDQESGLLFVTTFFGEWARVHVYKINLQK